MINQENLINLKEERDKAIHRIDVLDKVKHLLLMPYTEVSNIKQVSEFYEVEEKTIRRIILKIKDELEKDGLKNVKPQEFIEKFLKQTQVSNSKIRGKSIIEFQDGQKFEYNNTGMLLFPKRAILRIGMLLRDSEVAKEIRTQLLNIEEKSSNKIKEQDINEEMAIYTNIGKSVASGDIQEVLKSFTILADFKNRHIKKLEEENLTLHNKNEDLSINNKALAEEILTWDNRKIVNKVVRTIATRLGKQFYEVWNFLYDELLYKHSIGLKRRGKSPYIQHIQEDEWTKVISSLTAICEENALNFAELVNKEL